MGGELLLAIAGLLLKYGPAAALKIIRAWKVEDPTFADVQELKGMKPAEDYFGDPGQPEGSGE